MTSVNTNRSRHYFLPGACPSNGRDCDGSEMSRMRGGGSSRLLIMSLRDPTTKQTGHFRPTPQGGVLFGPPLRRGSSEYHRVEVRHRRRYLMGAKNHAVATRRLLGQAPSLEIRGRYAMAQANLWRGTCGGANIGWQSAARAAGANPQL